MEHQMRGRIAIITGAGGGIGRSIALRLAAQGVDLSLADVDFGSTAPWGGPVDARSTVREIEARGRRAIAFQGDVAERHVAEELAKWTADEFGGIDFLVNCAGGAITPAQNSFASSSNDDDRTALFRANYETTVMCCQSVIPYMLRQQRGSIVNITSGVGHNVVPRNGALAHYLAAKAAVTHYTGSLANELGSAGIRVNAVSPGLIMSPRVAAQAADRGDATCEQLGSVALRRFGVPDDVAKAVEFFCSDLSSYVTGQVLAVNGG